MGRTKEITITTVIGFLSAGVTAIPVAQWALAGEISKQVSPLIESQKTLLVATLEDYRDTVAALEFKRDTCTPAGCWTVDDARTLARIENKIKAAEDALRKLNP